MKIKDNHLFLLFSDSIKDFFKLEGLKLSASLSYYTIFALPSFAIFLISVFGYFLDEQLVSVKIFTQMNKLIGTQVADQIEQIVNNSRFTGSTVFETFVGFVTLLFSASGMFSEIQSSINYIWNIETKPKKSIIHALLDQFFSFSMLGIFGLLLLISLLIDTFIELFYTRMSVLFNVETIFLADFFDAVFVFVVITFLFFYILKELPDAIISFRDTLIGALFTAFLFMIGKWLIGIYIDNSSKFSMYGTAGSILILLFWVYYSAIILYFGAVFTKNYAKLFGTPIKPNLYSEFNKG